MGIPTWLLLLLVLVPTVCLIAYVSDNMGKQLGKKRISVFGLRPRQTATLLTMASGTGIMLLTFGALFGVSKQVRNDLFRAAEIRRHNEKLLAQTRDLSGQVEELNSRIIGSQQTAKDAERRARQAGEKAARATSQTRAAEAQLKRAQSQLNNTRNLLNAAQAQLASARRGESQARAQAQQAQAQQRQAQAQEREAQARFREAQNRLAQAQSRVEAAEKRIALAQARVQSAENRARLADAAAGAKQRQLSAATKNLEAERAKLSAAQNDLTRARGNFERVNANIERVKNQANKTFLEYQEASLKLASTQKEVNRLTQQIEFQKANLTALQSVAELALGGRVKVNRGQVFAERVILPARDASAMENEVRELMKAAQSVISEPPFSAKTLALASRSVDTENGSLLLSGEQVVGVVVQYLMSQRTPVALRVAAARNHIEGEDELDGMLLPIAVRPAFTRGETLAQAEISPSGGDARIFNALLQLVNAGERAARERGVSPPLTLAVPNFYASGTNERIFEALRRIAGADRPVTVRLVAADDLTTVEPLDVQFEVAGDVS